MSVLHQYLEMVQAPPDLAGWRNAEGERADVWLTLFLCSAGEDDPRSILARRATLTLFSGTRPALVARVTYNNDPIEIAFTPDGQQWRPDLSSEPLVGFSLAVPMILLALGAA